ncbi:NAD-dependent epimerase/dehydratase family protein [Paraburkholderia sp. GAS348]|uniref:NAD-dependent epimerase/dehydratase family protein n=1 Tax=Paraburkholderia sp. GAS348 TaxID=3035132 RepID=UPI003D20867B
MVKTILLTGVTGFLGSRLAGALLAANYTVVGLRRAHSDTRRIRGIQADLSLFNVDADALATPFRKHGKIDAVVHTATCYGRAGEDASEILEANTMFPVRLLETAAHFKVNCFLNTDTSLNSAAVGHRCVSEYALSKKQFLEWGRYFSDEKRLALINVPLEHMYGPEDDQKNFTARVINACVNNWPELPLTRGEQERDFVYVDDVVSAYLLLLRTSQSVKADFAEYPLGSGRAVSVKHFVETVHRISGSTTHLAFGAIPYREHEIMFSEAKIDRIKALGWTPRTSLDTGIKKVLGHV